MMEMDEDVQFIQEVPAGGAPAEVWNDALLAEMLGMGIIGQFDENDPFEPDHWLIDFFIRNLFPLW